MNKIIKYENDNLISKLRSNRVFRRYRKVIAVLGFLVLTIAIGGVCLNSRGEEIIISTGTVDGESLPAEASEGLNVETRERLDSEVPVDGVAVEALDAKETESCVKARESTNDAENPVLSTTEENADKSKASAVESKDTRNDGAESSEMIVVYVCGAVEKPGVVKLKAGSRVFEAIEKAGGMTSEADSVYLNLAGELTDGVKVYVPTLEETKEGQVIGDTFDDSIPSKNASKNAGSSSNDTGVTNSVDSGVSSKNDGSLVNINTATKEELMTLPGVGESKANSIIKYRDDNGGFRTIEDIMNITGIKEGLFNKIKEKITV
ncbi:MAG: ComEA family DNA-binding protein [Lachnospiraceae bacterium]|nr:ComEA family DNA-binding protein [Lachnospiraceae bacterium]